MPLSAMLRGELWARGARTHLHGRRNTQPRSHCTCNMVTFTNQYHEITALSLAIFNITGTCDYLNPRSQNSFRTHNATCIVYKYDHRVSRAALQSTNQMIRHRLISVDKLKHVWLLMPITLTDQDATSFRPLVKLSKPEKKAMEKMKVQVT